MSSEVSIYEVAKAAKVSICTVSRIVNGRTTGVRLSNATRQRGRISGQWAVGSEEPVGGGQVAVDTVTPESEPVFIQQPTTQQPLTAEPPPLEPEPVITTPPPIDPALPNSVNGLSSVDSQLATPLPPTPINQELTTPTPATPPDAPCPCGSGKKFKKCHGKWGAGQTTAPTPHPELDLIFTTPASPTTSNQAPTPAAPPPITIPPITSNPVAVAPYDPCPCGSGKKFKKCHGKWGAGQTAGTFTPSDVAPLTNNPITNNPGAVAPDDPCPCGSGKKYKKCHGKWGGKDG